MAIENTDNLNLSSRKTIFLAGFLKSKWNMVAITVSRTFSESWRGGEGRGGQRSPNLFLLCVRVAGKEFQLLLDLI